MTYPDGHPHLLLWYVSTRLESEERRSIESHLRWCGRCRNEAETLSALIRGLPYDAESRDPGSSASSSRAAWSGPDDPGSDGLGRRLTHRGWTVAAAVLFAAVAVLSAVGLFGRLNQTAGAADADAIVFHAPVRGVQGTPALAGSGPWRIRVLLPFDAQPVRYVLSLLSDGGVPLMEPRSGLEATPDGQIETTLAGLRPGRYRLVLSPTGSTGQRDYVYDFDVVALPWDTRGD